MGKGRMEAFSDGVIAIIITIMVLELKVPEGAEMQSLLHLYPVFLSYVLSFILLGIYWNNHHHMLQAVKQVNGRILWANMHLLFWLSLIPFATGWMGENHFAAFPVALYGGVLWFASIAYYLLSRSLVLYHGRESHIANALGGDRKGKFSMACYTAAVPLTLVDPWISMGLYVFVAAIWFIPDSRIEKHLKEK